MKRFWQRLFTPTHAKRVMLFLLFDAVILSFALYVSFLLRFEFSIPPAYRERFLIALPVFVAVKLALFPFFRLYSITWRYVGINEMWGALQALLVSEIVLFLAILAPLLVAGHAPTSFGIRGFPRSIFLLDGMISFVFLSAVRLSKRVYLEILSKNSRIRLGKRTVIVGAGDTGEMVIRDILKQETAEFHPVAIIDDNTLKLKTYVHGVPVEGMLEDIRRVMLKHRADAVIIAIPHLNHKKLRAIYDEAKNAGAATVKIVPRIYDVHKPHVDLKSLEDISIEDLIGRPDVRIDYDEIERFLKGKTVLVTGAGGSIGSEIVMQVCASEPQHLILLDIDETELHELEFRLTGRFPAYVRGGGPAGEKRLSLIVGDVRDRETIDALFRREKPQIVFHSAAYKHVPMMEFNPLEAVKVNVFGTYNLARAAAGHGVAKFIMISTDKAVRPTSIMGATKRVAEYVCKSFGNRNGTEFVSVRFGNVLGSRGSVLPRFLDQLKLGGPLTITHREMRRYFMTVHEAVLLVLQASVIGNDGEVMVLDMGEPVRIVDMAEELIRIHGLEPYRDIDLTFTGMRPGEKLFEEILTAEEGMTASRHEKIFIARDSTRYSREEIDGILADFDRLLRETSQNENRRTKDLLKKYVKHYDEGEA